MTRPTPLAARVALAAAGLSLTSVSHASVMPNQRTFIDSTISLPSQVTGYIGGLFPEASAVNAAYLGEQYDPNFITIASTKVTVTFVSEGAGYQNSLGYFTYTMSGGEPQILDRQLIFPNSSATGSGGVLNQGDTVTLRDADGNERLFPAGTRIGFFLVANAWNSQNHTVRGWNANNPTVPAQTASGNGALADVDYQAPYATLDVVNPEVADGRPELARHAAVIHLVNHDTSFLGGDNFYVLGIEDKRRGMNSDNDFNDVMFIIHGSVETALVSQSMQIDPENDDPDGDGKRGTEDQFPDDPLRATVTRYPGSGLYNIAFEDMYPRIGDYDFNDAVVRFSIDVVKDASQKIKEIVATYHLVARGAGYDHAFGVGIDKVPATATGTIEIDRFSSSGEETNDSSRSLAAALRDLAGGGKSLRIDNIFPSTQAALSPRGIVNTLSSTPTALPASARVRVVFDTPLDPTQIDAAPFDPYLAVRHGSSFYDIHLVGKKAFLDRPASLPTETGSSSFRDSNYHPWALLLPDGWRYPLEGIPIGGSNMSRRGYTHFDDWRLSRGSTNLTWYSAPNTSAGQTQVIDPLSNGRYVRPWSLKPGVGIN